MTAVRAWLLHPVTVIALVVLVVNDHVLKARYPGLITGKLSDVAGLVLTPPLLAAIIGLFAGFPRAKALALAATGVGFAAVKVFPVVALIASGMWSVASGPSVVRADPSDLIALPALGVAAWVSTNAGRTPRALGERLHRVGILIVLPTAALALAATSAPHYPYAAAAGTWRDLAMVGDMDVYIPDPRPDTLRVSGDGGHTWRRMTPGEEEAWSAERPKPDLRTQVACSRTATAHCYRVVPGHLKVEQSDDSGASWQTSWEVPDRQRDYLARSYEELRDVGRDLSSLAVAVVPTAGGDLVIVANGRDGYAVRDAGGHWERIGFGRTVEDDGTVVFIPPRPLAPDTLTYLAPELLAGLLAGLIAIGAGGLAAARRRRRAVVMVFAATLGISALVAVPATAAMHTQDWPFRLPTDVAAVIGTLIAVVGALGTLITATAIGALAARWTALIAVIGAAVAGTYGALYTSWSHGTLGYRVASLIAIAVAIAGIALAAWLGRRVAREPQPVTR